MRRIFPRLVAGMLAGALGPVEALAEQVPAAPEAALAPEGAEEQGWLTHRLELINELTLAGERDSRFNPEGELLDFESRVNALRLNGEFGARLPADLRLKGQVSSALRTGRETTSAVSLRELYATASLGDFELSAGRRILKWTNGYAFNPAGLLEPQRSPSDPQDRLKLLQGREMLQLDYFAGDHTFTAVFSTDALTAEDDDGLADRYDLALRANVLVTSWNLDLAAVALVSNIKNMGALSFSYVLGDALELHGEVSGSRGSGAEYPRIILPENQQRFFLRDYLGRVKQDETRLFLRYVVGVNYTLPMGTTLIGEFFHSDDGLSSEEWVRFITHADFSRDQMATGHHPRIFGGRSLPELSLLQGLGRLSIQNIRRNYVFLRDSQTWLADRVGASALALVNLDDPSAAFVGEGSYLIRRGATVYARASVLTGDAWSEFGNLGQRASLNV
ncbi:MAG TPA: hypothetical protein VE153_07195, partial [Myxococcus sp.]|nr:hypothetical protein [Myxococcus sp.]